MLLLFAALFLLMGQINNGGGGGSSGTVSANNGTVGALANYAAAGGSTTVGPDANLDDGGTTANTLTYKGTGGVAIKPSSGTAGLTFSDNTIIDNNASGIGVAGLHCWANAICRMSRLGGVSEFIIDDHVAAHAVYGLYTATDGANTGGAGPFAFGAPGGTVPVKVDTTTDNNTVSTTTTDTGAGIVVGVSPVSNIILTVGSVPMTLGTGTCSRGNFVIVDTTTNGRVKCTSTYTAGTVIGVATTAQAVVGSNLTVMIGLR